jgi:hypothetical protein
MFRFCNLHKITQHRRQNETFVDNEAVNLNISVLHPVTSDATGNFLIAGAIVSCSCYLATGSDIQQT